ncbi:polysaccharide deacetylase family protein [Dietzia cinnamea]|uniref:polysaccharide deacetylase family protein n=1 Tax=Dietzia cinnamea TaxID=321318 RepID=UPI0021A7E5D2|nr:polysaccharide deacetylase family protein [Dietzia cinnamea]MCT2141084.1 polysaccharide deacetylase family protein [Dietzia cinnamea]
MTTTRGRWRARVLVTAVALTLIAAVAVAVGMWAQSRTHYRATALIGPAAVRLDSPTARQEALEKLVAALKAVPYAQFDACLAEVLAALEADLPPRSGDMLSWDDVRRLHRWGVDIGAHTVHHPILANADDRTAAAEIVGSRDRIAAELGEVPRHFAYPNGGPSDFLDRDVTTVADAGFVSAVTTVEGINLADTDRFRLLRFNLHEERFRAPTGLVSRALFFSSTSGLVARVRSRPGTNAGAGA